jgi:transcriptional regulator with XRE-family HTH domain
MRRKGKPMQRPKQGRKIDQGQRNVSGSYFDLVCAMIGVSQEEVARRVGVAASTLSRAFSGKQRIQREQVRALGEIMLELCPPEERELLLAMEVELMHSLGYATQEDERRGVERLPYFQQRVDEVLSKREPKKP